jgi:hypothetical protein
VIFLRVRSFLALTSKERIGMYFLSNDVFLVEDFKPKVHVSRPEFRVAGLDTSVQIHHIMGERAAEGRGQ